MKCKQIFAAVFWFVLFAIQVNCDRSFIIDYDNDQFLKDGEPFRYVAGEIHYFRIPHELWQDRLHKARMGGLNAVQVYVEWNQHEPESGDFRFEGQADLVKFLQLAQAEDLLVTFRAGPYICAERDMGGIPYWLLRDHPDIELRTADTNFLFYVDRYMEQLFTQIKPMLYQNGGPIITVQVENEYGSYGCDSDYKNSLRDIFRKYLGDDVILYTTDGDGDSYVTCGNIDDVYATIDFGAGGDVPSQFEVQRHFEPHGPLINSEYYTGWLDHWGEDHSTSPTDQIAKTLNDILAVGASVSMYMYHGGTNWGLTTGANGDSGSGFDPDPTSYDYDAPLSEAGDPTDKYFALRDVIAKYIPVANGSLPEPSPKLALGKVSLSPAGSLFDFLSVLQVGESVTADSPLTFEALSVPSGYVLYETTLQGVDGQLDLSIPNLADSAYVLVNDVLLASLRNTKSNTKANITVKSGDVLRVLVEDLGRVNFGSYLKNFKGLGDVSLGGNPLTGPWTHYRLPLNNTDNIPSQHNKVSDGDCPIPGVYIGEFVIEGDVLDTFLDPTGMGKGVAVVNGHVLGRYWPTLGPQVTLYVPGVYLQAAPATNKVLLVELEQTNCQSGTATINFVDTPYLDKPTTSMNLHRRYSLHR